VTEDEADDEMLSHLVGLHVGQLTIPELEALGRCVRRGTYRRAYEGASGFLGLPKVQRVTEPQTGSEP
jgi:hypothetical protein